MRIDLYAATPGAVEAFKREAETMKPGRLRENAQVQDDGLLNSIGDERTLTRVLTMVNGETIDNDEYELLFARRNVVARLKISYGSYSAPATGSAQALLEYAAGLDQNIQGATSNG